MRTGVAADIIGDLINNRERERETHRVEISEYVGRRCAQGTGRQAARRARGWARGTPPRDNFHSTRVARPTGGREETDPPSSSPCGNSCVAFPEGSIARDDSGARSLARSLARGAARGAAGLFSRAGIALNRTHGAVACVRMRNNCLRFSRRDDRNTLSDRRALSGYSAKEGKLL